MTMLLLRSQLNYRSFKAGAGGDCKGAKTKLTQDEIIYYTTLSKGCLKFPLVMVHPFDAAKAGGGGVASKGITKFRWAG